MLWMLRTLWPPIAGPYCPGCGYCLVGVSEYVCPECGREFTLAQLHITADDLQVPGQATAPGETNHADDAAVVE